MTELEKAARVVAAYAPSGGGAWQTTGVVAVPVPALVALRLALDGLVRVRPA